MFEVQIVLRQSWLDPSNNAVAIVANKVFILNGLFYVFGADGVNRYFPVDAVQQVTVKEVSADG